MKQSRRTFLQTTALAAAGIPLLTSEAFGKELLAKERFKISLAEWSLHRALWGKQMTNLDFPVKAKKEFGINGVEYVSTFFKDTSTEYLNELLKISKDNEVTNVLIMIDGQGSLGDTDASARTKAVENHKPWIEAAKFLGCHSIRVNAAGKGTEQEVADGVVESLSSLCTFAAPMKINVVVENHGGYSSNGKWLSGVMKRVNMKNCGTLPDFGNFRVSQTEEYDRYLGMQELMPFAKGVSAKSHEFDAEGNETKSDFYRMIQIVKDAGYKGWVDVEYEGSKLSEPEGIMATKRLLEKAFTKVG
ncbi:MAG TPA: sugar phosphate isomerase/epimerase family protein [Bacteroidales bacterium]|jgi:sugar phosphate isomerase/epimerase|nr:sugar phosphate isomerase/epimerase family protein [Bacteroidales bacterium]